MAQNLEQAGKLVAVKFGLAGGVIDRAESPYHFAWNRLEAGPIALETGYSCRKSYN